MTAFPLGIEVVCDGPDGNGDCPDSAAAHAFGATWTAREIRADFRHDGWTTRRAPGRTLDLCPDCRTARTQAPEEPTR
ncbi:hypothetical protein ACWD7M_16345 [Streptomyces griseus]